MRPRMPIPLAHVPRERQCNHHHQFLTNGEVAQLDEVHSTNELRLRNNEDEQEKNRMESIMDNFLVQHWWQYEDEVAKYE
eukprot:1684702-Amphidinium_carterae.1